MPAFCDDHEETIAQRERHKNLLPQAILKNSVLRLFEKPQPRTYSTRFPTRCPSVSASWHSSLFRSFFSNRKRYLAVVCRPSQFEYDAIVDSEGWDEMIEESEAKLIIIDVHLEWCGPCEATKPLFTKMLSSVKKCSDRVGFYSAEQVKWAVKLKELCTVRNQRWRGY